VRQHYPTVDPRSLENCTSRKVRAAAAGPLGETPDSVAARVACYLTLVPVPIGDEMTVTSAEW